MFVDVYNHFYNENDCFINKGCYHTNMQYNKVNGRLVERRKAANPRAFREPARGAWPSTGLELLPWRWLR